MTIENEQRTLEHRRLMKELEARARRSGKKLSLRLCQLDWRAPMYPSRRCSEMDDNQFLTTATYTKIYIPTVLPYRVQFRRSSSRSQCWIRCHICFEVTLPRLLSQIRSRLRCADCELHNYNDNWQMHSTSESSPSNQWSQRTYLKLVAGGATTCKRTGWPFRNLKQLQSRKSSNEASQVMWEQAHLLINRLVDLKNHDKCTENGDGYHTYRWIDKHPRGEPVSTPHD